jgi:hypothetical protein
MRTPMRARLSSSIRYRLGASRQRSVLSREQFERLASGVAFCKEGLVLGVEMSVLFSDLVSDLLRDHPSQTTRFSGAVQAELEDTLEVDVNVRRDDGTVGRLVGAARLAWASAAKRAGMGSTVL